MSMIQDMHKELIDRGFQSMITNPTYVRNNPSPFRHYCRGPITVGIAVSSASANHDVDGLRFAAHIGTPPARPLGMVQTWLAECHLGVDDLKAIQGRDQTSEASIVIDALTNTYLMPTCVGIKWMSQFIDEWSKHKEG